MKATLFIPDSKARQALDADSASHYGIEILQYSNEEGLVGFTLSYPLRWTTVHAASSYGLGVLLYRWGQVLDGFSFRELRDNLGATIRTSDPEKVRQALGVPIREPGIIGPPGASLIKKQGGPG